jgi:hypothetical protein
VALNEVSFYSAIPEPGIGLMLALGGLLVWLRRRR